MTIVYPDTNALWGDPFLSSTIAKRLLASLQEESVSLQISPIVQGELRNRLAEELQTIHGSISRATGSASSLFQFDTSEFDQAARRLWADLEARCEVLLSRALLNPVITFAKYPSVSAEDMAARALTTRRPFTKDSKGATVGHNDVLIWEGLKQLLRGSETNVIFVTKDRAFLGESGQLHRSLVSELAGEQIDPSRVVVADSLHRVVNDLLLRPYRKRDEALIDHLRGIAQDFPNFSFGWSRNLHTGELEEADYPLDIDRRYEGIRLLRVADINHERVGPGEPPHVEVDVRLHFQAWLRSSTWREIADDSAELWLAEPNSGTVSVGFSRVVRLSALGLWSDAGPIDLVDGNVEVTVVHEV